MHRYFVHILVDCIVYPGYKEKLKSKSAEIIEKMRPRGVTYCLIEAGILDEADAALLQSFSKAEQNQILLYVVLGTEGWMLVQFVHALDATDQFRIAALLDSRGK